jgi:Zn-dependent alcohol dehydrogenase
VASEIVPYCKFKMNVRSEVLLVVKVDMAVFFFVMKCGTCSYSQCLRRTYCYSLSAIKIKRVRPFEELAVTYK